MKRTVAGVLGVMAACSANTTTTSRDAAETDRQAPDAAAMDATLAMDTPVVPRTCTITADGPRALQLRGQVRYFRDAGAAAPVTLTEARLLFLPRGRAPDAPLIVGFLNYAGSFVEVPASFDARAGLDRLFFAGSDSSDVSWTASMAPPDGALALQITRNLNTTTDVGDYWQGAVTLCPEGDAPTPTLRPLIEVGPVGPWRFEASAPVAAGAETITLRSSEMRVETGARWEAGWLTLTPARSVAPGSELTLDVSGLRDPVGRVFALDGPVRVLATTAVVTDRGFDTAPPAGAVQGGRASSLSGALHMSSPTGRIGPYVALMALGESAAGQVTVRYRTRFGQPDTFSAWLVRSDGRSVEVPVTTGAPNDSFREARVRVEGSGPLWLQITDRSAVHRPGWLPRLPPVFELDEVRLGE